MRIKLDIKNRWTGAIIFEFETENNTIAKTINEYVRLATANLTRANLTRADLTDADLTDADLADANLNRADLTRANLTRADLTRANLTDANLADADLTDADLADANLNRADLTRANLTRADLTRANLTDANLTDANLTRADLTRANLERIKFDFFGRMLALKNEVPFLKEALISGKINGSSYTGVCGCFMATIAHSRNVDYTAIPEVKPDVNSNTERWFLAIKEGDTPAISTIAKQTLEWIEEFEMYLSK